MNRLLIVRLDAHMLCDIARVEHKSDANICFTWPIMIKVQIIWFGKRAAEFRIIVINHHD